MYTNDLITVKDVLVRKEVITTPFACDLKKCKGGCCTIESDYGAPLLQEEVEIIEKILPVVKEFLPENHVKVIETKGFHETIDGELMTASYGNKACVFVYYDKGIAKCGIEKAYYEGKVEFKKPLSCHLFPIRVSKFGGDILRYEKFHECAPAIEKGTEKNIKIIDSCREALIRLYGEKWFLSLKEESNK